MKKLLLALLIGIAGFGLVACDITEETPKEDDDIVEVIPGEDDNKEETPGEDDNKEETPGEDDNKEETPGEDDDKEEEAPKEEEKPEEKEDEEEDEVDIPNIIESTIVFYEIYSHGGNKDATFKHDYVVLKNTTDQTIDLNGLFIQYASENGKFGTRTTALNGKILPNQTFKIKLVSHSSQGEDFESDLDLSNIDKNSDINLAGTSGQIGITNIHIKGTYEDFKDNFVTYIKYKDTGANNSVIVEDDGTLTKSLF